MSYPRRLLLNPRTRHQSPLVTDPGFTAPTVHYVGKFSGNVPHQIFYAEGNHNLARTISHPPCPTVDIIIDQWALQVWCSIAQILCPSLHLPAPLLTLLCLMPLLRMLLCLLGLLRISPFASHKITAHDLTTYVHLPPCSALDVTSHPTTQTYFRHHFAFLLHVKDCSDPLRLLVCPFTWLRTSKENCFKKHNLYQYKY